MIEQVNYLEDVLEPQAGQTVYVKSTEQYYRFDPIEGWQLIDIDKTLLTMNAYEMNKQIVGQLEILDKETIAEKKQKIFEFCEETNNTYYMLLCREQNYYTVFHRNINGIEFIADVLIECAEFIGDIKAIDFIDGAIEIWVDNGEEAHVMYFFPYDEGVEICR